jgi:hypothetical protein
MKGDPACHHTSDALRAKKVAEWKAFVQKSKEDAGLSRGDSPHCNFCAKSSNPKLSSRAQTHNTHHEDGSIWCYYLAQQKCDHCEEAGRDSMGHTTGHWSCPLKAEAEEYEEEDEEDEVEDPDEDQEENEDEDQEENEVEDQEENEVEDQEEEIIDARVNNTLQMNVAPQHAERPNTPVEVILHHVFATNEETIKDLQNRVISQQETIDQLRLALQRQDKFSNELKSALQQQQDINRELMAQNTREEISEIHQTRIESLEKELKKMQRELLGVKAAYNAVLVAEA